MRTRHKDEDYIRRLIIVGESRGPTPMRTEISQRARRTSAGLAAFVEQTNAKAPNTAPSPSFSTTCPVNHQSRVGVSVRRDVIFHLTGHQTYPGVTHM